MSSRSFASHKSFDGVYCAEELNELSRPSFPTPQTLLLLGFGAEVISVHETPAEMRNELDDVSGFDVTHREAQSAGMIYDEEICLNFC